MIWEYLFNFFIYTAGMVALIYLAYFYLKVNHAGPNAPGSPGAPAGPPLRVESVLHLEPRKRLYVISYGKQRFLISSNVEKTELLSTLQEEPVIAESQALIQSEEAGQPAPVSPLPPAAGFMERLQYSVKMVLADRFPGLGGK